MTPEQFASNVIGASFRPHGRGPAYDCWGLVCDAYRKVSGIELDDYGGEYDTLRDRARLARIFSRECGTSWTPVDHPKPMDVAVIYREGRAIHAGLYLGNGQILHIERGIDATVQPTTDFRIEAFYRPAEVSECE